MLRLLLSRFLPLLLLAHLILSGNERPSCAAGRRKEEKKLYRHTRANPNFNPAFDAAVPPSERFTRRVRESERDSKISSLDSNAFHRMDHSIETKHTFFSFSHGSTRASSTIDAFDNNSMICQCRLLRISSSQRDRELFSN